MCYYGILGNDTGPKESDKNYKLSSTSLDFFEKKNVKNSKVIIKIETCTIISI